MGKASPSKTLTSTPAFAVETHQESGVRHADMLIQPIRANMSAFDESLANVLDASKIRKSEPFSKSLSPMQRRTMSKRHWISTQTSRSLSPCSCKCLQFGSIRHGSGIVDGVLVTLEESLGLMARTDVETMSW